MFTIKTLNKISLAGLERFDKMRYEYGDGVNNPDGILVRSAKMHDMELSSETVAIARAGAGVNNIPVDELSKKGVCVFNTPGGNANGVKELVLCALFLSSRKIVDGIQWASTLSGEEVPKLVEKGKSSFTGPEIKGKKLGVIGLGAIGVLVANAAAELGMTVSGYDPYISVDRAWGLSSKVGHATSLKEIYETSDYISVHVPANDQTKGLIDSESINAMKHGVRLLNFARGEIVVTKDILAGIDDGKIEKYITDFPNAELLNHKGVVCIPHLAASTPESEDNCAVMAADQLIEYLENGNIVNSVNMPATYMPRSGKYRICIIHDNKPGMISGISTTVSEAKLNVENLVNKSRKGIAYTMLDVDMVVNSGVIDTLKKIEGIIGVRVV